jgi:hypothetical protein
MFARRLLRDADSQFIGDLLSVRATAAYSLRRLYSSYTGNALTLRRSQDNAVADIGFTTAGELDTTALLNHVGYQNLLTHSEQFDNANWFKNNWSPLTNSAIAPNGTLTADKFVENTANGFHSTYRTSSVGTLTGTYTFSVYLKAAGRSWAIVRFNNRSNWFNLADGVLGTVGAGYTALITPAGDGWYRCAVTLTATALDTFPEILIATGNNVSIYTGDGTSGIFVWGAQFNQGSTPQPYQQTTTTAWTSLNGFVTTWYDQSGGSNNAIQSTLANQPRIVANGVLQSTNNRPSILNAADTGLAVPTITELNTSNTTSAVVRCTNVTSPAGRIVCLRSTSALNPLFDFTSTTVLRFWVRDSGGNIMQSSAYITGLTYNSIAAVRSINQGYIFTNGFANTVGVATPNAIGSTSTILGIGIGCDITPSLLFGLEGDIGEVVIFNSALSIDELRLLQQNQGAYYRIQAI